MFYQLIDRDQVVQFMDKVLQTGRLSEMPVGSVEVNSTLSKFSTLFHLTDSVEAGTRRCSENTHLKNFGKLSEKKVCQSPNSKYNKVTCYMLAFFLNRH